MVRADSGPPPLSSNIQEPHSIRVNKSVSHESFRLKMILSSLLVWVLLKTYNFKKKSCHHLCSCFGVKYLKSFRCSSVTIIGFEMKCRISKAKYQERVNLQQNVSNFNKSLQFLSIFSQNKIKLFPVKVKKEINKC